VENERRGFFIFYSGIDNYGRVFNDEEDNFLKLNTIDYSLFTNIKTCVTGSKKYNSLPEIGEHKSLDFNINLYFRILRNSITPLDNDTNYSKTLTFEPSDIEDDKKYMFANKDEMVVIEKKDFKQRVISNSLKSSLDEINFAATDDTEIIPLGVLNNMYQFQETTDNGFTINNCRVELLKVGNYGAGTQIRYVFVSEKDEKPNFLTRDSSSKYGYFVESLTGLIDLSTFMVAIGHNISNIVGLTVQGENYNNMYINVYYKSSTGYISVAKIPIEKTSGNPFSEDYPASSDNYLNPELTPVMDGSDIKYTNRELLYIGDNIGEVMADVKPVSVTPSENGEFKNFDSIFIAINSKKELGSKTEPKLLLSFYNPITDQYIIKNNDLYRGDFKKNELFSDVTINYIGTHVEYDMSLSGDKTTGFYIVVINGNIYYMQINYTFDNFGDINTESDNSNNLYINNLSNLSRSVYFRNMMFFKLKTRGGLDVKNIIIKSGFFSDVNIKEYLFFVSNGDTKYYGSFIAENDNVNDMLNYETIKGVENGKQTNNFNNYDDINSLPLTKINVGTCMKYKISSNSVMFITLDTMKKKPIYFWDYDIFDMSKTEVLKLFFLNADYYHKDSSDTEIDSYTENSGNLLGGDIYFLPRIDNTTFRVDDRTNEIVFSYKIEELLKLSTSMNYGEKTVGNYFEEDVFNTTISDDTPTIHCKIDNNMFINNDYSYCKVTKSDVHMTFDEV
jgi:hypothetical protein